MDENIQTTQKPEKKISFISAMLIVIGGSIGAGIFFKSGSVLNNAHSSLVIAIFCWLIASCAVICMALALIEISSVKNDNLSLMSWNKVFNSRRIYNASKDFMTYVYLPLTYLFMPLYVIMSLQDGIGAIAGKNGFGTNVDWLIWTVISLAMSIYFLTVPALWSKVGDIQNIVVLAVKFIPLVFVTIIGFVLVFTGNGGIDKVHAWTQDGKNIADAVKKGEGIASFQYIGAGLGVFLSIAAIFFAYDGFYVAAGIQSEMKEPKKTPLALFLGLAVTTLIYVILAVSMSINGGSFLAMNDYMKKLMGEKAANIVFGIVNICIAIGVLGIINGFSMWAPRYVEDLLAQGDLPFWEKAIGKLNPNKPKFGIIYSIVLTVPIVLIFTVIGALGYLDTSDYGLGYDPTGAMAKLYSFADLMANWTALFTFGFIAAAIYGGIKNRKTNKIEIANKKKYFIPTAWVSVIIVGASLAITVLVPFVDLFLIAGYAGDKASYDFKLIVVSRIMLIVVLFLVAGLTFLPLIIADQIHIKKYGSIKKYEEYVASKLATVNAN
ncbi:APC family permease [Mycoplasmopsis primatum]|uniref:APC family permease n=1 Tax=Mycoplasmopsis primatum TaxID=55604 RepID=UPI000494F73E|nr:APC family permease [Mycoplasmopsis primatum]